jgi:hypothetical protein
VKDFWVIALLLQYLPDIHFVQGVTAGLFAGGLFGVVVWMFRNRHGSWLYGLPLAGWLAVVVAFYVLVFHRDAGYAVTLPYYMDFSYLSALVRLFGGIIVVGGSIGLVIGKIIILRQERKLVNDIVDSDTDTDFDVPE